MRITDVNNALERAIKLMCDIESKTGSNFDALLPTKWSQYRNIAKLIDSDNSNLEKYTALNNFNEDLDTCLQFIDISSNI